MTAPPESFSSLTDARVTSRLGEMKRRVGELGEDLQDAIHGRVGSFVHSLLSDLESHSCRIAVIGQIKAGKSTLINALIRRPDLLPTDVNPSTAVITKLYFGSAAEQNNTALFQFFSDDEWERIMSGGRAGAMTMERHAALRPEQLEEPLEELRQRAETRLGAEYPKLLGKHHLFSSVTAGLLERYVSAGDYDDVPAADGDRRHYSDITKTAEVFLEGQPLGYPSIIIDTPGVNDPFLVRDEITQGNLGDADIYLVVLTAQQPLSKSDLALLRMLKGLQKDRIIAVVNRIDLVNVAGGAAERLAAHVRASLKREFPHTEIPVVLASAHWGNAALSPDIDERDAALASSFGDYAEDLARHGEPGFERPRADWTPERSAQMLYRASGIPAIVSAISRLIGHSVTAERLLPVASTLGAIAENTSIAMRYGIKTLQGGDGGDGWIRGRASRSLQELETLLSKVEATLATCEHEFTVLTAEEIGRLRRFMIYTADNFAEQQRERLLQYGSYAAFRGEFQEQTFQLRSQLAEDFYKYITEISKQFLTRQQEAEAALRVTVQEALPALDNVLHFGIQATSLPPPSIMPLSKVTGLDLDSYWLPRAHAAQVNPAEAEKFKQLVSASFAELIEELFQLAEASQKEHVSDALRRLRFLSYSAVYPIAQQLQQLVSARKTMSGRADGGQEWVAPFFWDQFLAECRQSLLRCEELSADSVTIRRQCIQMMSN
ncbi:MULTISPECIES: dynamin family protein [Rhodomicrobium]|uniref:dynamin family protein n=1 Tax=Rhodomicrobium TaxID=1068 RepID=UPI000B4A5EAC|nr:MULTISPECIES: dynamin family protein [Rhodomicrobium]